MLSLAEQAEIVDTVVVPEIRSSVAQTLRGLSTAEDPTSHRLTLIGLLGFYRKAENVLSVETSGNILKSRLMGSGVFFFGPMFCSDSDSTKSQRLSALAELGMAVEHLAFLNPEQVELFYTYLCETGLVSHRA